MKKKLMASILAASMLVSMAAGCGNTDEQTDAPAAEASGTTADAAAESGAADTDGEEVTIKLFSNLPDRKNGQGLVEQTIIDQYMSENPNARRGILQDEVQSVCDGRHAGCCQHLGTAFVPR